MFRNSSHMSSSRPFPCDEVIARKKELRKEIRSKLKALSKEEIRAQSVRVWDRLFELPQYRQARSIGLFLSMPTGEISTELALKNASENEKQVYVPQVGKNFEQADMELIKVVKDDGIKQGELFYHSWPLNKWGIPEPPPHIPLIPAAPGDIDVIVVPGLAFDEKGNRLGQGKGYYDRFIARMTLGEGVSAPFLVGVGLECQLTDRVPVEEYDQLMDLVLLPSQTIVIEK